MSELSRELLCFHCDRFVHKNLPSWLPLKNLRILQLGEACKLEDLWECDEDAPLELRQLLIRHGYGLKKISGLQRLRSLETLRIHDCTELKTLPSLAGWTSLKEIELFKCEKLEKIESIEALRSLETLRIHDCTELKTLPSLAGWTSLKEIVLYHCKKLEKIEGIEALRSLEKLGIHSCTELKTLPSLAGLTSLKRFDLSHCNKLEKIESIEALRSLERLGINNCTELKTLPSLAGLTSLKEIVLFKCKKLEKIESIEGLRPLKILNIMNCPALDSVSCLAGLTCLEVFELRECEKVDKVEGLEVLTSLKKVVVQMCSMRPCMLKLPEQSERLKSVEVVANRLGVVEPSILDTQKWPREEIICTRAVIDVQSLRNFFTSTLVPENVVEHGLGGNGGITLSIAESAGNGNGNVNAILICFIVHSIHSNLFFQISTDNDDDFSTFEMSIDEWQRMGIFPVESIWLWKDIIPQESKWVWMGIFPQESKWLHSEQYHIQALRKQNEFFIEMEVEVKEGWLLRGKEQSIREAFHHLSQS